MKNTGRRRNIQWIHVRKEQHFVFIESAGKRRNESPVLQEESLKLRTKNSRDVMIDLVGLFALLSKLLELLQSVSLVLDRLDKEHRLAVQCELPFGVFGEATGSAEVWVSLVIVDRPVRQANYCLSRRATQNTCSVREQSTNDDAHRHLTHW